MVRDHKVVGSNPVASTIKKRAVFAVLFFIFWLGATGFEGRVVGGKIVKNNKSAFKNYQ